LILELSDVPSAKEKQLIILRRSEQRSLPGSKRLASMIISRFQRHVRVDAPETHRTNSGAQSRTVGKKFTLFESAEHRLICFQFLARVITTNGRRQDLR
jgi:hypothetical protein